MTAPAKDQAGRPCGGCLNCRNGFAGLCVNVPRVRPRPSVLSFPDPAEGKTCNECGSPVAKGRRYCDECRRERRRQTWRESQDRRRCRIVEEVLSEARLTGLWRAQSDADDNVLSECVSR